jgi:hypothetical protein
MLFRLLVAFGRAKPLTILLVRLILSIKLFPKGLGLREIEVKAIHCVEEFLFLLLSLRWFDGCWKSLSLKEWLLFRVKLRQKKFALKFTIPKNRLFTFFARLPNCLWLALYLFQRRLSNNLRRFIAWLLSCIYLYLRFDLCIFKGSCTVIGTNDLLYILIPFFFNLL